MKSQKPLMLVSVLVLGAAAVFLWRHFSPRTVNLKPSAAVGELLAHEAGQLAGPSGKVVLLSRPVDPKETDANGERVHAFMTTLRRQAGVTLVAEWAPRQAGVMDVGAVSTEQFVTALERHPDAKVLLVFAGLPAWSQDLAGKISARSLKVVAVCGYGDNVRRWLESGSLALAAVPRFDAPPENVPAPQPPRDWFDREFLMVRPDTVSQLPF
ncbi:MAG TPA: hypothetical protein PKN95_07595 [Verrucomicrobiota bacterium]|nr:hypothetical protein [Verrucomicrobiota bacterium]HNT14991.1 hypothetical protein [Verrucomicrobiota bacterium]